GRHRGVAAARVAAGGGWRQAVAVAPRTADRAAVGRASRATMNPKILTPCLAGSSTSVILNSAGVYRFSTQAIDRELNFSSRQSAVVRIGGATGDPPLISAVADKSSGTVPFTMNIDMSGSTDAGGTIVSYYFNCGGGTFTPRSQISPFRSAVRRITAPFPAA